jgi:ribosome-binding factor A
MSKRTHGNEATRSQRQLRVGEEIRHALTDVMREAHFRDPDLQGVNVTITEVQVSPDLKNATVFVMTLGGEDLTKTLSALKRAGAFLRSELAHRIQLRYAPSLKFEADATFDYAAKIDAALHRPEVARDLDAAAEPDESDEAQ